MPGSKRAALFAGTALLVLACGQKFVGVDTAPGADAGSGGMPSSAGGETEGNGNMDGGVDGGGTDGAGRGGTLGGAGQGGKAGKGGAPNLGGAGLGTGGVIAVGGGASGGSGGGAVVVDPPIPREGLELWFSADEGVTQNADGVSTWKDRSGNHRDALQTAINVRPQLVADALAGKPAVVFDGDGQYLKLPTLDVDFTGGLSIFVVAQQPAGSTCEGYFEASRGSEKADIHFGYWQESLLFEVGADTINDTDYPALVDTPEVAAVIQDAQATATVRSNSNEVGSGTVNLAPAASRTEVFLGKTLYAGCTTFNGAIGEVLVYSRPVSDQELLQIEGYLQSKWMCCEK